MARFRKKPVIIDAVRVSEVMTRLGSMPQWVMSAYARGDIAQSGNELLVHTAEGVMRAGASSWLIKGVKGELYFCLPDVFNETYEAAA